MACLSEYRRSLSECGDSVITITTMRLRTAVPAALAIIFLLPIARTKASIVISELMWSGSGLSAADEWIELTNTGTGAVSLSGWTLTKLSKGSETDMLTIPAGATVGSGKTFLISNYPETKSRLAIVPNYASSRVSLANTKLLISLYDGSGALIDAADDGIGVPFAGSNANPKSSMERIDLSGSGQLKSNWRTASTFINFDDGAHLFGTPGAINGTGATSDIFPPLEAANFHAETVHSESGTNVELSWVPSISLDLLSQTLLFNGTGMVLTGTATGMILPGMGTGVTFKLTSTDNRGNTSSGVTTVSVPFPEVLITEVMPNPKGADDEEWIEIGNLGAEDADVSGWILDEGNSAGNFEIPSGTVLAPGARMAFPKSVTGLPLGNNGENISLTRGIKSMDSWTYPKTAEEVSYGRLYENPGRFSAFCVPTPNAPNKTVEPNPEIVLQSGSFNGVGKTRVNLMAEVQTGSTAHAHCKWDYAQNALYESCNPPPHTFAAPGTYIITMDYSDFCGNSIRRSATVTVTDPAPAAPAAASSSGGGGGGNPGRGGQRTTCRRTLFDGVRISEFIPNPEGRDEENEWIELENTLDQSIDLCGWELDDGEGGSRRYPLDAYRMSARQFLVLERRETKIALNNTSDSARLFAAANDLIEEIAYEKSKEGFAYARDSGGVFRWTATATPGTTNKFGSGSGLASEAPHTGETDEKSDANAATAAARAPSGSGGAAIYAPVWSEIMPNPPIAGYLHNIGEYIELYNPHGATISLDGWILDDNPDGSSKPLTLSGFLIAAKSYAVLQTRVSLNNEGEEISLTSPNGDTVLSVEYPKLRRGDAYVYDTRGKSWVISHIATPGAKNIIRKAPILRGHAAKKKKRGNPSEGNIKINASQSIKPIEKKKPERKNPISFLRRRYRPIFASRKKRREANFPEPIAMLLNRQNATANSGNAGAMSVVPSLRKIGGYAFMFLGLVSLLATALSGKRAEWRGA